MEKKKTRSLKIMNMHIPSHIVMIIWCFIVLAPIYLLIINSFKNTRGLFENLFSFPSPFILDNYKAVTQDGDFFVYFRNSIIVVVGSLLGILFLGSLASFALAQWTRSKFSSGIYFFFIIGMMLPIKIASIRLLEIMKALGLIGKLASLFPVYIAMGLPIAVFVLTEFIRGLPVDLYEAAYMDGAKRSYIYTGIVLPLIKPAMATVAIYNLVPIWNDLWFPLILVGRAEGQQTILFAVSDLQGQYTTQWTKIFALLTLSAMPVLILYLLMSRQFVSGLTAGAVKG
ncbi:MAG: carbohydrate ABC transporter permease [Christensenellales bacterium]|jgi:raffinose/stachyose/melibiose transport system permease protein|nr:carbohydrate ABC transporter permease [Christensenellaceae bacterium]